MRQQTINEERGSRKAADLRRRFARVSRSSLGRPGFRWENKSRAQRASRGSKRQDILTIVIFLTCLGVVGSFLI